MKKLYVLILMLLLANYGFTLETLGKKGGEYILKIDNITVYQNQFENEIMFLLRDTGNNSAGIKELQNSVYIKNGYARSLINIAVVLKEAKSKKFFNSKEEKSFLEIAKRNIKSRRYAQNMMIKYANDTNKVNIGDKEVEEYIKQSKEDFIDLSEMQKKEYVRNVLASQMAGEIFNKQIEEEKNKATVIYNSNALDGSKDETWIMKINGKTISIKDFETEYNYLTKYSFVSDSVKESRKFKEAYLDSILLQYIIIDFADKENFFDKPEEIYYIDYSMRSAKVERYMNKLIDDYAASIPEADDKMIDNFISSYHQSDFSKMPENILISNAKRFEAETKINEHFSNTLLKTKIEYNEIYFK